MENVFLLVQLIIAFCLIAVVLLQRSEGGGLGMGGGGAMTGRQAATAMTKVTWILGIAFMVNSTILVVLSAQNSAGGSIVDILPEGTETEVPALPSGESLLPPTSDSAPLTPPRSE